MSMGREEFFNDVLTKDEVKEKFEKLKEKFEGNDPEAIPAICELAGKLGYDIKPEDLTTCIGCEGTMALSASDKDCTCACVFGGGGPGDIVHCLECACVLGGVGRYNEDYKFNTSRCVCALAGGGTN